MNTISEQSPHLNFSLTRLFGCVSRDLDYVFQVVMENGGAKELYFSRPEGQSFNPRPARVSLIPILAKFSPSEEEIIQCLISCLWNHSTPNTRPVPPNETLIVDTIKHCEKSRLIDHTASVNDMEMIYQHYLCNDFSTLKFSCRSSALALSSLFIDRIRHAHLGGKEEIETCLALSPIYLYLTNDLLHGLSLIIEAWTKRIASRKS